MIIVQSGEYISGRKSYFLRKSFIWASIIIAIFMLGIVLEGTRASRYTVIAAVLVLGFAQNITRYISYMKYRDPIIENTEMINKIDGKVAVFHSAIVPFDAIELYFEHIIIASDKIYFIASDGDKVKRNKNELITKINNKGLTSKKVEFIIINKNKTIKRVCENIQKEVLLQNGEIDETIHILKAMIM